MPDDNIRRVNVLKNTELASTDPCCGEALPALLAAYGVRHVFGIPGNHTLELYRGLADSRLTHITTRHEQGAGFMADGYARATGAPGVCFLISGPGLLNAATALGQALADSVPVLVITAVAATQDQGGGLGQLHELPDQQATAASFCRLSLQVSTPSDVLRHIATAFAVFESARPGPVHIQIPLDVIDKPLPSDALADAVSAVPLRPVEASWPADAQPTRVVDTMLSLLSAARRPLLVCGGGACGAAKQWRSIAESLDLPVINTTNAKGLLPPDHPLAVGGSPSLRCVREALAEADVVLAVGTEFGETDYDLLMDGQLHFSGMLLRIDIDPQQLQRHHFAAMTLCTSAKVAARYFAQALELSVGLSAQAARQSVTSEGAKRAQALRAAILSEPHWQPEMASFFATLTRALGDTCIVGDSTRPTYYASWQYEPVRPRRYFHSVTGFGTLGYAIPAAMGAALALDEHVLAIVGDGGAQFTLPELACARDNAVPVTVLVWSNRGYEEIENSLRGRSVDVRSTAISAPDFKHIAAAYHLPYARVTSLSGLYDTLRKMREVDGPTIVEVVQSDLLSLPSGQWYD